MSCPIFIFQLFSSFDEDTEIDDLKVLRSFLPPYPNRLLLHILSRMLRAFVHLSASRSSSYLGFRRKEAPLVPRAYYISALLLPSPPPPPLLPFSPSEMPEKKKKNGLLEREGGDIKLEVETLNKLSVLPQKMGK